MAFRSQRYCACQLIAAINARIFLGGKDIAEEDFERLVDETCGRIGSCIGVEKAYSELGLSFKCGPTSLRWIKRHLPVEIGIRDPKYGFHAVLITAVRGRQVRLINGWKRWVSWKTIRGLLPKYDYQRTCKSYAHIHVPMQEVQTQV